jgi:hypothetical protein
MRGAVRVWNGSTHCSRQVIIATARTYKPPPTMVAYIVKHPGRNAMSNICAIDRLADGS